VELTRMAAAEQVAQMQARLEQAVANTKARLNVALKTVDDKCAHINSEWQKNLGTQEKLC
jgi:hypothetical protein